jgi:hypothetical protein
MQSSCSNSISLCERRNAAEIHRQLVSVYGEGGMKRQNGFVNLKRQGVMFMMKMFVLTDV